MSFAELIIVFIVAIIVLGPERLPTIARQAGRLYKKAQDFAANVQNEISNAAKHATLEENEQKAKIADTQYQTRNLKNPS